MSRLSKPWKELQDCVQSYTIEKAPKELLVSGLRREGYADFKGKFYVPGDLTQPIAVDTVARKIADYLRRPKPFREIKDYEARKEAKRSKLTSALLQDNPAEAKKQLGSYLAFLEENPLINISNRYNDNYIDSLFNAIPERRTVLTFLDTIEKVIVEAGADTCFHFCYGAPQLYASLSPEKVTVFVEKGIALARENQELPQSLSVKKKEQERWHNVLNYFNLKNALAQETYSRLLQEETSHLLRESREQQRAVGKRLELIVSQLTVVAELRHEVSDYSGKLIQAERDRGVLERAVAATRVERDGWKEKWEYKDREVLQKDLELKREKTLRRKSVYTAWVLGILAVLACGADLYTNSQAKAHSITIPATK